MHYVHRLRESSIDSCMNLKECEECVQKKGCGWCENSQACINSGDSCEYEFLTDKDRCPDAGKKNKKASKRRPCDHASNCFACKQLKHCSWFAIETKHICVSEDEGSNF